MELLGQLQQLLVLTQLPTGVMLNMVEVILLFMAMTQISIIQLMPLPGQNKQQVLEMPSMMDIKH